MSGPNTDYDPVEVTPLKADQVEAMREAGFDYTCIGRPAQLRKPHPVGAGL